MEISSNNLAPNFSSRKADKKKSKAAVAGTIAATTAAGAVQTASSIPSMGIMGFLQKVDSKIPQDKIDAFHNATKEGLKNTGLADKGVKIAWLKPSGKNLTPLQKILISINPAEQGNAIKEGLNAGYSPLARTVFMPENKLSASAFHELGHAINHNCSKFWKSVQGMRNPAMVLASIPMLYGALTKESKAEDGKELTKKQKANNFVRNNAGKLSFIGMLPILAEEGMASIRGQKIANTLLPKNLSKMVLKNNIIAYGTYLLSAVGVGLSAYTAVKVKDHFVNKHNAKMEQKNQVQNPSEPDVENA